MQGINQRILESAICYTVLDHYIMYMSCRIFAYIHVPIQICKIKWCFCLHQGSLLLVYTRQQKLGRPLICYVLIHIYIYLFICNICWMKNSFGQPTVLSVICMRTQMDALISEIISTKYDYNNTLNIFLHLLRSTPSSCFSVWFAVTILTCVLTTNTNDIWKIVKKKTH
jgi:hypothetical protein